MSPKIKILRHTIALGTFLKKKKNATKIAPLATRPTSVSEM